MHISCLHNTNHDAHASILFETDKNPDQEFLAEKNIAKILRFLAFDCACAEARPHLRLNGMNPSSSSGSQSSFIRDLASSLVSFSPRLVSRRNSSWPSMVSSLFLSYSFRISTKSWNPPWSLDSLQALYMGKTSALVSTFLPFSFWPPISSMVLRVGFRLQARSRSPA